LFDLTVFSVGSQYEGLGLGVPSVDYTPELIVVLKERICLIHEQRWTVSLDYPI
jgi:hypothetical protein